MTDCLPSNTPLEETGFGYTLSLINGKYKMIIMYWLYGKPLCVLMSCSAVLAIFHLER